MTTRTENLTGCLILLKLFIYLLALCLPSLKGIIYFTASSVESFKGLKCCYRGFYLVLKEGKIKKDASFIGFSSKNTKYSHVAPSKIRGFGVIIFLLYMFIIPCLLHTEFHLQFNQK